MKEHRITQGQNTILNREFLLKISGNGYNTLAGWPLLVELVGEDLANKALCRAISSGVDKYTWKLRRGIKLDFYSK